LLTDFEGEGLKGIGYIFLKLELSEVVAVFFLCELGVALLDGD